MTLAMWQATGSSLFGSFPFLILMMVALFALMILPNQRKQKQWAATLAQLKVGDKVVTTGGVRGTVFSLKDDSVVLRVAPDNLKMEVVKTAVASITTDEAKS